MPGDLRSFTTTRKGMRPRTRTGGLCNELHRLRRRTCSLSLLPLQGGQAERQGIECVIVTRNSSEIVSFLVKVYSFQSCLGLCLEDVQTRYLLQIFGIIEGLVEHFEAVFAVCVDDLLPERTLSSAHSLWYTLE